MSRVLPTPGEKWAMVSEGYDEDKPDQPPTYAVMLFPTHDLDSFTEFDRLEDAETYARSLSSVVLMPGTVVYETTD